MRADVTSPRITAPGTPPIAADEPTLEVLIAELASAGLVSVDVSDGGDVTYALTPRGQQAAQLMAMSRAAHALVLMGALVGASRNPH